ncbi:hypothetical protein LSAT2_030598, partial [Lamellibrachia satsuma]
AKSAEAAFCLLTSHERFLQGCFQRTVSRCVEEVALAPSATRHLLVLLFQGSPIRSTLLRPFVQAFPVSPVGVSSFSSAHRLGLSPQDMT